MSAVALKSFGFGDQLVRVTDRSGAVWFVANDVCGALEISNPRDAVKKLEADEKDDVGITDAIGRNQQTTIISESGVYSLIFKSRKPSAVQFRKWVTGEVLPAIRQTGRYEAANAEPAQRIDEPGMPEFAERVRVGLQLVREARIVFGREAARRAWLIAGLPDLSEQVAPPALTNADQRQVAAWFGENVEAETGSREGATRLYMDYARWCNEGDERPVAIRRFADTLKALGVDKTTSNGVQYLDIRLKTG